MIACAAAVVLIIAACLHIFLPRQNFLTVSDQDSGKLYLSLPLEDGERFTITYRHSVNQTPVAETYELRGADIFAVSARFYNFGAGMQTDYPPECSWYYADDGAIVVEGYNIPCPNLSYCVSKYYDHVLNYRGSDISLGDACGKGSVVDITIRNKINVGK